MAQETTQPKYTRESFAKAIKAKYPAYQEMDDNELVDKIVAKYPQYAAQIGEGVERNEFGRTEEEQAEWEKGERQKYVNEGLLSAAGIPEPLHGIASSVNQTLMGLTKGIVETGKAISFGLDSDVQEQLKENPKAVTEVWDNYWNAFDDWDQVEEIMGAGTKAHELAQEGKEASITGLISQGEFADAAVLTAEQTAGGAISLIPAFFGPWGAAFMGVSAAGSAFDEDVHDEEKIAHATKDGSSALPELYTSSLLKGGVEFATELVTSRLVGGARKMAAGGATKAEVNEYLQSNLASTLGGFGMEGFSEGLADTASKIVDEVVYDTEHDTSEVLKGFWDNFIIGGLIGGKVSYVGNVSAKQNAKNAVYQATKSDEHIAEEKQDLEELKGGNY